MLTLALDTSTYVGTVSVTRGGELLCESSAFVRASHGETLLPHVERSQSALALAPGGPPPRPQPALVFGGLLAVTLSENVFTAGGPGGGGPRRETNSARAYWAPLMSKSKYLALRAL